MRAPRALQPERMAKGKSQRRTQSTQRTQKDAENGELLDEGSSWKALAWPWPLPAHGVSENGAILSPRVHPILFWFFLRSSASSAFAFGVAAIHFAPSAFAVATSRAHPATARARKTFPGSKKKSLREKISLDIIRAILKRGPRLARR